MIGYKPETYFEKKNREVINYKPETKLSNRNKRIKPRTMVSERKQNRKRVGNRDDKNHKQGTKVS